MQRATTGESALSKHAAHFRSVTHNQSKEVCNKSKIRAQMKPCSGGSSKKKKKKDLNEDKAAPDWFKLTRSFTSICIFQKP